MTALLLTAALVSQPPAPPAAGRDAAANSIDGTWTVVAFEKNG